MEDRSSQLEWQAARICDLLLGPPPGQARLADRLDEVDVRLRVELATRQEVDVELEALRTSVARVQDLVLGSTDGPSSLVAYTSVVALLLEGRIDATIANGVRWGSHFALVDTMSHFPVLETELEVLGSRRSADMIEDEIDALECLRL
jgi:hypothetical protein